MPRRRLILFDIDGTLISSGPVPRQCMAAAVGEHLMQKVELSFHDVAGSTDPIIVRQALLKYGNGAPIDEGAIGAIIERYLDLVETGLSPADSVRVFPGARELIEACRAAGWATAIMTGNVERGARIKLADTGLWELFAFGIFGDDGHKREDLPFVAAERAWDVLGEAYPAKMTVLVGDTPADARVARNAGMAGMVVCRRDDPDWRRAIEAERPTWLVDTLEETQQLIQWIKEF